MREKNMSKKADIDWNALVLFAAILFSIVCVFIHAINEFKDTEASKPITSVSHYEGAIATEEAGEEGLPLEEGVGEEIVVQDEMPEQKYIGECRLTVYTPYCDNGKWGYQTATGEPSQHLMTCAVDPNVIPYGSNVIIRKGDDEIRLKAIDCGGAVKGNDVDIFYDGRISSAIEWLGNTFGDYAEVWIEEAGE